MQKPSGGVQVIAATPNLGPVNGKAPIIYALPALVGHHDQLREALVENWQGRDDAVFLVPAVNSNKKPVVWRVFWEKGAIRLIEECVFITSSFFFCFFFFLPSFLLLLPASRFRTYLIGSGTNPLMTQSCSSTQVLVMRKTERAS